MAKNRQNRKRPKQGGNVDPSNIPTEGGRVESIYGHNICWHMGLIDFSGAWGFSNIFSGVNFKITEKCLLSVLGSEDQQELTDLVDLIDQVFPCFPDLIDAIDAKTSGNIRLQDISSLFRTIYKEAFFEKIHSKIRAFENKTWREVLVSEGKRNHEVEVSQISRDAQRRLVELKLDDVEKLVSLRLSGPERLWGIRREFIFQVLWWDPNHSVYPTKRVSDNTN